VAVVDNGIYVAGRRVASPSPLDQTFEVQREHGGIAWIGLRDPSAEELGVVAAELGLHELAVEDALKGKQRSKLETFGDTMSVVVRSARYHDDTETVRFSDVHIFVGAEYLVTVCQAASPDLVVVRRRLEADPELLAMGPIAILYGILDQIVDGYQPVIVGLENDIDEIEDEIFGEGVSGSLSRRIYELHREVIGFERAVHPLADILGDLSEGAVSNGHDVEIKRRLRDVHDHVLRVDERIDGFRALLDNALTAYSAIVSQQQTASSYAQNEQVKRISAWAAILFAPSLVGTVYGMNFRHMPELSWVWGYPFALGLMATLSVALFVVFKRVHWL
jgi:magnesium transporter